MLYFLILLLNLSSVSAKNIYKSFYNLSIKEKDAYLGVKIFDSKLRRDIDENPNYYNLSIQEKDHYLGLNENLNLGINYDNILLSSQNATCCLYPSKVDLRNYNGSNRVTPVKNQGQCGSCVAFAAVSLLENIYYQKNVYKDFSENDLFFCKGHRRCQDGWYLHDVSNTLKRDGVNDEHCCSYRHHYGQCCHHCSKVTKIDNFYYLNDDEIIKKWIADGYHVLTYFIVYADFYDYRYGIYKQNSNNRRGAHAVAVIGFNDELQYWIGKNSWGNDWGEHGFFRIKYNEVKFLSYGIVYIKKELDDYDNHERIAANNIHLNNIFKLLFVFFVITNTF